MRTATLAAVIVIAVIGGLGFVYSGIYHVGATDRHLDLTYWLLDTARFHSIKAHAAGISVPDKLDDQAKVTGTEHFAAHCAVCHGAPGVPKGDIAVGLYSQPPDLANAAKRFSPAELFWIMKNRIKMTGMPAWAADHSDDELWATVAFLEKLPGMTQEDFAKLVMASMAHGDSHHEGGQGAGPAVTPHAGGHSH